ncbi:cupredoxin domain-containing protein [Fimbriimonas ginsengisoli]|uniref:Blue (type 1) copper domain-containing protein n=1 Tax=Fimbriimonas ginsengisoli Gsoil 348 TaxID=661478 RepID=A0A068NUE4_FIMGI|nr:plastocyanin/azurin family copper-binding protein [Fimbriimonas ginsengisoli]AIE85239.1 hypothetical protein OP10G_1871 [Fimbriimonas ginsengisoli Gsoil 348]
MKVKTLLLLSLLALAGCGGSSSRSVDTHPGLIRMEAGTPHDMFSPASLTVPAGTTVRWTNGDADAHTVKPDVATAGMDSDTMFPSGLPSGASFEWTVPSGAASGTKYYYHCRFHGAAGDGTVLGTGMAGVVIVR